MWAETATLLHDLGAANVLRDLLRPFDGVQIGTGGFPGGPAARLLARLDDLLGEPHLADSRFESAVEFSGRIGSPVWSARCRLDWAESLLARGEVDRAAALAGEAELDLGSLDLPALRQRQRAVRDELDRTDT